jgi:hypothetical protein
MNRHTYYNPTTNRVLRVQTIGGVHPDGYHHVGYKKIAEAFTSLQGEERKALWKALIDERTWGVDFSLLNSKVKHKLKRLGLKDVSYHSPVRYLGRGGELLIKINKKK